MVIGIMLPEAQELVESLPRQRRLRWGELELPTALYLTAHEEFSFLPGSLSGSRVAVALTSLPFGMSDSVPPAWFFVDGSQGQPPWDPQFIWAKNQGCRSHPRVRVRRASGFVLTGQAEVTFHVFRRWSARSSRILANGWTDPRRSGRNR